MSTNVTTFDYISNFLYENGELKMIYHPEGDEALRIAPGEQFSFGPGCRAAKPTPPSAENDTEFVFDYFIKDYLGNVRVVMTEEDATYTTKFLATLEDVHAEIEERNFENLEEVREDLPTGYPVNGSASLNERIALLNAANGTEIGPSIVLPVRQGERVSLSTEYFYTEDAAGATYDNIDFLINEVLIAFAAGGSGILPLNETQLIDIASGQGNYSNALANLFNNEIDTTDMSRPYAYMVWTAYDANMNIIPSASGIERVSDPNDLEALIREEIAISADGFLHAYVSNGSAVGVNFDNFQVTTMRGKVRQINHYYPYGLTISGIGTNSDEYLNKYTTKELQTGEWNPAVSNGLEMYDFHARHYDPQLGRWFAPDPAEQFSNPYLGIANNPVNFVDPDGEFAIIAGLIIKKAIMAAKVAKVAKVAGATAKVANVAGAGTNVAAAAKVKTFSAKGIISHGKSGAINTLSNYDSKEGLGWHTLGDFTAGAVGSMAGVEMGSKAMGMFVGGTLNAGFDGVGFDYEGAQSFVGGALSVWSGMGKVVKGKTLLDKTGTGKGLLKKQKSNIFANTLHQHGDAFLKYGLQANAYDFAYSKQEDYLKRTWSQHLGIFAVGGAFGAATQNYFTDNTSWDNLTGPDLARSGLGFVGFAGEYTLSGFIKKRFDGFKDDPNKIAIFSGKWLEQTIVNFSKR
jgi:RHS repeat-associated protein